MALSLIDGNEAIALGAIASGCRFFAGYPITPATSIFNHMLNLLPPKGGICMQAEDEIASIGSCLGASVCGLKAMTATSGPGISLYSENISFAIGCEIPIVIVDVQRLGPSTGSATRGADGDIMFLRWGSSSGLPAIVLAPSDVNDCYMLTQHAFNFAEQFGCPVFIASNKEIALTKNSIDLSDCQKIAPLKNKSLPDVAHIGGNRLARRTSSTHGADGYITTDPDEIEKNQERLTSKIVSSIDNFTFYEEKDTDTADIMIITYGITSGAVKEAASLLKKENVSVSFLILKTLWPVPEKMIKEKAKNAKRIIVFEMNKGQYLREITRLLPDKKIEFFGQMNGIMIDPEQIMNMVKNG